MEVGDVVLAEDPQTGERGLRTVTHLWAHQDSLVDLEIDDVVVATTEDHPFWNHTDAEWQRADSLDPGDLVLAADGDLLPVNGVDWETVRTETAHNLTVDGIHTYYVQVGDDHVLVHNTNPLECQLTLFDPDNPNAPNSAVRCAANSFVPGTEVLMADGTTKPIEDVEIGDWVWVHDPETGETGARKVVDTIVGDGEKYLVDIEVLGDTITATDGHPFWITNDGAWADADDLEVGDRLLLADGDTAPVTAIDDRSVVQRVHNLTVDGIHTYFVSAGDEEVLVHNCRVGELKLADEFAGADADELAQLARGHGDVDNLTRPSFDQVRAALDTDGVRIRDGLDGRDLAVMFQHNGVTVIINEARPTRSTAFFAE